MDDNHCKELFIFSGLGADERVFQKLNFPGCSVNFIKWIEPLDKETIENYAGRIKVQINKNYPILVGLSFGGIMAIEVAKQIEIEKVILIASSKTKAEIPFYYRFAGFAGLHKLLPLKLLKRSNFFTNCFFGATSNFDKNILKEILRDTDPKFLRWAIDKIVHWKNEVSIKNTFHIHGTSDRILPIKFVSCNQTIKNGGHFMTLNKSEELDEVLMKEIG